MSRKWATGIVLCALAGCSGPGMMADGGTDGGMGDLTWVPQPECIIVGPMPGDVAAFDAMAKLFYAAECRLAVRCADIQASEEAKCNANYAASMANDTDFLSYFRHRVRCGATVLDESEAQRCIASYDSATCADADVLSHCLSAVPDVPGWVPAGGIAEWPSECVGGFQWNGNTCGGICTNGSDSGPMHKDGGDGAPCVDQWDCRAGLFCDGAAYGHQGVCQTALAAVGEPCAQDDSTSCALGLTCDKWTDVNAPVCITPRAVGESCASYAQGLCGDGLVCLGSGVCAAVVDVGGACDSPSDSACAKDLRCGPGTCVQRYGWEGDPCVSGNQCMEGLYCDGGICKRQLPRNAECVPPGMNEDNPCAFGVCDASHHCDYTCDGGFFFPD